MEKQGYRDTLEYIESRFPDKNGLTVHDAAEFFGISESAVYDAIRRKKNPMPAVKVGGQWFLPFPLLARWMC